jgi:hypothetical protein
MDETFELKALHVDAIPEALRKAERYRLLNEPEQAESICRDVLRAKPGHQEALVVLILAITDQFASDSRSPDPRKAWEFLDQLAGEYPRAYYTGLVHERNARAVLARGKAASFAYAGFREAMRWYEKAEELRPPGVDDPILRWNACVRTLRRENIGPRAADPEHMLE